MLLEDNWEEIPTPFQAKGWADFERKVKQTYWTALKMNWKVWTPFQFINVNFVPVQVRILLTSCQWVRDGRLQVLEILILYFCFSVQSTFCQHGGLLLVCVPCVSEKIKLAWMSSRTRTMEQNCIYISPVLLFAWLHNCCSEHLMWLFSNNTPQLYSK